MTEKTLKLSDYYIKKSENDIGLVRSNGSVDTTNYATQSDVSNKADKTGGVAQITDSNSDTYTAIGNLNKYVSQQIINQAINAKINTLPIVENNLESNSITNALSAAQGKVLKTAIDSKQAAGDYAASEHTHTTSHITDLPAIATNLTTDDDTKVLSAKQGYNLQQNKLDKAHTSNKGQALVTNASSGDVEFRGIDTTVTTNSSNLITSGAVATKVTYPLGQNTGEMSLCLAANGTLAAESKNAHTHTESQITDFPTSMTPTSHASTSTTYGVGDANNYGHVKVDTALSDSSTNPIQNKVVNEAIGSIYTDVHTWSTITATKNTSSGRDLKIYVNDNLRIAWFSGTVTVSSASVQDYYWSDIPSGYRPVEQVVIQTHSPNYACFIAKTSGELDFKCLTAFSTSKMFTYTGMWHY